MKTVTTVSTVGWSQPLPGFHSECPALSEEAWASQQRSRAWLLTWEVSSSRRPHSVD